MIEWLLGKVVDVSIGGYLKAGLFALAGLGILGIYAYHESRTAKIEELQADVVELNASIVTKDQLIALRESEIDELNVRLDTRLENFKEGEKRVGELNDEIDFIKKEHKKEVDIWKKRADRLSSPYQRRPHTVIKLINNATKKVFNRIETATSRSD